MGLIGSEKLEKKLRLIVIMIRKLWAIIIGASKNNMNTESSEIHILIAITHWFKKKRENEIIPRSQWLFNSDKMDKKSPKA
jgi:hypothetical protein